MTNKRFKSTNWDEDEKEVLRSLIKDKLAIIECKDQRTVTNRNKQTAWNKITELFSETNKRPRKTKQLIMQWKMMSKKHISKHRRATARVSKPAPPSAQDMEVAEMVPFGFNDICNDFDSDDQMNTSNDDVVIWVTGDKSNDGPLAAFQSSMSVTTSEEAPKPDPADVHWVSQSTVPKVRPRMTNKAGWSMDQLNMAVKLIDQHGYSMRKAAKSTNIPFSSLQKRYSMKIEKEPRLGRTTVFTPEMEVEFANTINKMIDIFYGCTANQIKKAAFDYAEALQLKHNFNMVSRMAGRVWFECFISRNDISVRKPETTSIKRVTTFNKTEVKRFYKLLKELVEKHKFLPKNIYNCDETGIPTVQDPGKALAAKRRKRIGSITRWEKGKNITLLCTMSAAGEYIPPMFIFPRKKMTPILEKDGPAGAIYKCSDTGWINEELFLEWVRHFSHHARPSADEPVLLILDNHASHISLGVFEHCKKNHIHMLSLPPHTSHRMQPLDVSFFGPLKAAYRRECDFFMKRHLAKRITPYNVASLVKKAFSSVASISKGEAGFKATGIFPMDPNMFSDEDFTAAVVIQSEPTIVHDAADSISAPTAPRVVDSIPAPKTTAALERHSPIPSTSRHVYPTIPKRVTASKIQDFMQMHKKSYVLKTRQGRKKQHATPIEENMIKKECKKKKGKAVKGKPQKVAPQNLKKKILQESEVNTNDDDSNVPAIRCLVCGEFGRDKEMWFRCTSCGLWAHADCTGWNSARNYVCDMCCLPLPTR